MDKKEYNKQWYEKNKDLIAEKNRKRAKEYYYKHREEKKEYQRQYRLNNFKKTYESTKKWKTKNKKHYDEIRKTYEENNKEILKEKRHQYYLKNQEKIKSKRKEYYKNNKDKVKEYYKKRSSEDSVFRLKVQSRKMIINSFLKKGMNKSKRTEEIIGMPLNEFYCYLLQTFENNYGYKWDGTEKVHIDHIKPLKLCKNEEEVIKCCYYTNLQLLKAKDNLKKSDKLDWRLDNVK